MKKKVFLNIDEIEELFILKHNKCICKINSTETEFKIKDIPPTPIQTELKNIDKNNISKSIAQITSQTDNNIIDYELQIVINYKN